MAGTMSRADLVASLKDSLHDAASVFTAAADADFIRLLDIAALDFGRVRPRRLAGQLTVVAGKAEYFAPAGMTACLGERWGVGVIANPWDACYPGPNPRVTLVESAGVRSLMLEPAPTALQISLYGSVFPFYYLAAHQIGAAAADTTLNAGERGLLLLRAQAEAMRELAIRNVGKPVQMRDGFTGAPRNGTPAALYRSLLDEFEARAA